MKIVQLVKRKNLALLVPVLTILAMGLVGCSNNDDGGGSSPVAVTFKTVVTRGESSFAINTDGKLYTWGKNNIGQLGDGTTTNRHTPTEIMAGIKTVVAGQGHTLAISTDGKLYGWGVNHYGQLGNGKAGYDANYNHKQKEVTPQLIEVYE